MAEFRASMEEKDRSVAMFDKRLSQRFRNSFPRRTNGGVRETCPPPPPYSSHP